MKLGNWLCLGLLLMLGGPAPAQPPLVKVAHRRELRGAWVASVANINFPSRTGLDRRQQKQELLRMLTCLQEARFNAVFFQVRPEGDALYRSHLEPWSRFLSGLQGQDPGYDPLAFLIREAHRRNLEVHAWLNPYRARGMPVPTQSAVAPHLDVLESAEVHPYGQFRWMDPAAPVVRERLVDVCRDLVGRYDLDGLHFDDYFYPYPEGGQEFPDESNWLAYQAGGGKLERADWRRENVNRAIEAVSTAVHEVKDSVRFGISPFGIPAPARPSEISGMDQYAKLYADTQLWMDKGWVDYLAPQLYWPTTKKEQAFQPLLEWWDQHVLPGHYIFPGLNLAALGSKPEWALAEYRRQIELTRAGKSCLGSIWWNVSPVLEDRQQVVEELFRQLYARPALTPPLAREGQRQVRPPHLEVKGSEVFPESEDAAPLRAWTVYREAGVDWELVRIVPGVERSFRLEPGRWAIAQASMHGVESPGQIVDIP